MRCMAKFEFVIDHVCTVRFRRLAAQDAARIFATDTILTTLMCVKSSKYSWDLVVTKIDGKVSVWSACFSVSVSASVFGSASQLAR